MVIEIKKSNSVFIILGIIGLLSVIASILIVAFVEDRQSGNKITYIGRPRIKTGKKLTLDLLYDITNPYGFRDWDWGEFKLHPDLELEERINQFEILKDNKEELRKKREKFVNFNK